MSFPHDGDRKALGSHGEAGMTLLDTVVALAIFTLVVVASYGPLDSAHRTSQQTALLSGLNQDAHRVLSQITSFVIGASGSTLVVGVPGDSTVTFSQVTGYVNQAVVMGSPTRFELEYAPGELDDGIDNNGDGLVDECQIVLTLDPGTANERSAVIVGSVREYLSGETPNGIDDNGNGLVDERGLSFELEGGKLLVRLTLERIGPDGAIVSRDVENVIAFRN